MKSKHVFLKIYTQGENPLNSLEQILSVFITERHSGKHNEYWIRTLETHVDGTWPTTVADLLIILFNPHLHCLHPVATLGWRETASMWTSLAFHPWRVASSYSAITLLFLHILTLPSSWMKPSPLSLALLMAYASQEIRSTRKEPPQALTLHSSGSHRGPFLLTVQMSTWSHPLSNPKGYHIPSTLSLGSLPSVNMLFSNSIPSSSNCSISSYLCS